MYYVLGDGGAKYGPADVATLNQWAAENRVTPTTMLEDMVTGTVSPASEILQFPGANPVMPPMPAQMPTPAPTNPYADLETPSQPSNPYGASMSSPYSAPQTPGQAANPYQNQPNSNYPRTDYDSGGGTNWGIAGWVLGAISLCCCPICLGPAAIGCAVKAKQEGYKHAQPLLIFTIVMMVLGFVVGVIINLSNPAFQRVLGGQ